MVHGIREEMQKKNVQPGVTEIHGECRAIAHIVHVKDLFLAGWYLQFILALFGSFGPSDAAEYSLQLPFRVHNIVMYHRP